MKFIHYNSLDYKINLDIQNAQLIVEFIENDRSNYKHYRKTTFFQSMPQESHPKSSITNQKDDHLLWQGDVRGRMPKTWKADDNV
jgi:hypothetical protein